MRIYAACAVISIGIIASSTRAGAQNASAVQQLTIQDLQRAAVERNVDLLAARQEIAAARGVVTQSRLRPNPGLDVALGSGRPLGSTGEHQVEIGYAQTFEVGGKRARRIDVARVGVEIAELQVADRERQLVADVKTKYAAFLAASRNLETLSNLYQFSERASQVAERRVSEGEAAPLERVLLQAEVGRLAADRFRAAAAGAQASAELKLASAIDLQTPLEIRGDLSVPPLTLSLEEAVAMAIMRRADLNAARAEERQAQAEVALQRANRTPDVVGLVRYTRSESPVEGATGQLVPVRVRDNVLTAGISIPLPFANRNQGNLEAASARAQAAALRRQFVENSVRTDVTAAYTRYVGANQALQAFEQSVIAQSQQSIAIIRTSYDVGEVPLLDVLQEQRRYVETEKAYTDVLQEHYAARAALEEAIGAEVK